MGRTGAQGEYARRVAEKPYRAFMSYSHADGRVARKLHRKLETYRLPRQVSAAAAANGSERLGPIFRDREDFPAAADLSESIKRALDQSAALIVVCSPDARHSPWVIQEIGYFRKHHPDRPVLAALIAGEPADAFPDPLLEGAEPLAADLRPEGDGTRLGFLKLVAGLAGVPLDALVQRDAQRRVRRVTAVTLVSLFALLVMAGMTILAIQSRNEAERQRAEAEGLIEYMLTDLRDDLRGVGRLDVMTDVNERAMEYYEGQGDLTELTDESLQRRARVIGEIGEDDENRGDLDLAQARYEELHRTTAAQLEKDRDDPQRVFAHANSENRLALFAFTREQIERALAGWQRTKRLLSSIRGWGENRPGWLRLSALVEGNVCAARLRLEEPPAQALENCRQAVRHSVRLVDRQSDSATYDLVFHQLWLAEALIAAGRPEDARRIQRQYLAGVDRLVASDPQNMLWREQQMEVFVRYAEQLEALGEAEASRRFIETAGRVNRQLIARDANNVLWARYARRLSEFE